MNGPRLMLSHNVFFKLKDRSPTAIQALVAASHANLATQPGTVFYACGTLEPKLTRPVNDREFDVALHVVFTDRAAHDAYQTCAPHQEFIASQKDNWDTVRVFDSIVDGV